MEISLKSLAFGAALSLICVVGLSIGVTVLFNLMEGQSRQENPLNKSERVQRYLVAIGILLGQMFLIVALLMKCSGLLNNVVSWAVGFIGGIFAFSLLRLPFITRKK